MSEVKPVGRFIEPGPRYRGVERCAQIRSYSEYSEASVADSKGYWLEGEKVFSQSQVFEILAAAPTPPQAAQSVTMANVMRAYEYACDHPHKYLRGASNWCAAVAWKLNQLESPAATPPQPIYDEAAERKLFEAVQDEEGGNIDRDSMGYYENPYVQSAWDGWMACAQSRAKAGEDV